MDSVLQTAKEVYSWAKSPLPSNAELEVFLSEGRGRSIIWSEKKCEDISQAEGGGAGIRVILREKDGSGRQGYAFTTSLLKENITQTTQRAYDVAKISPSDPFKRLPSVPTSIKMPELMLYDPEVFSDKVESVKERLSLGENDLLKRYPLLQSVLRAGFSEGITEAAIVSSNGIEKSCAGTHCGLGVSCLAEKDSERQEGGFGLSRRFKKELDWDSIFEKAAQRTLALLGGKPIPSGTVPVIFDPSVACEFLSLVSGAVCADSVQKGKSFFTGKLGETVAGADISIIDDGTIEKGLATSPVDDEGWPTQKTMVIEKGKLNHFLYDTYTALKDKTVSTGNAARHGFRSSPTPGSSNFYLAAGNVPRKKLLEQSKGLYLYEVMGLHMADPISGDFSVGVIGSWLENGEFKSGVRGVTLAGNLLALLKNIDAVCDDLTFFGSIGSPTFRVELTVSGHS